MSMLVGRSLGSLTMWQGQQVRRSSVLQGLTQVPQEFCQGAGLLQALQQDHHTPAAAAHPRHRHQEP